MEKLLIKGDGAHIIGDKMGWDKMGWGQMRRK
jgi:hypothetical protein